MGWSGSGASWLRCDLHVHTPFDSERRFGENIRDAIEAFKKEKPQRLAEIAERFVDACRKSCGGEGLDIVGLTDHNSIEGYRYLKPYFDGIAQKAKNEGASMPVMLPGAEFSVGGERPIHFLVIFSVQTKTDDIDGAIRHIFGPAEPFDPRTGTPRATGQSVGDFLDRLYAYCLPPCGDRRLSFIVMPAHADSDRGLGKETAEAQLSVSTTIWDEMRGHLRERVITRRDWHGFQTLRKYSDLPEAFRDLLARWMVARRRLDWEKLSSVEKDEIRHIKNWPLIECSDPHKYDEIGSKYTWLKMEMPDVEGIRLALLDPESRLRRMAEGKPGQAYPTIQRVEIRETDFFEDIQVPLNPCLNTLIGGRGSGKSTVVESIRYALDRARDDDFDQNEDEIRQTVRDMLSQKGARDYGESKGMLLPGHEIIVHALVAGREYRISRSAAGMAVEAGKDNAKLASIDVRTLIVPRILSQRQVARIARDASAQRRELDALSDPSFMRDFADERQKLMEELQQLQGVRRQLKEKAASLPARQTELRKVADQIKLLERGGSKETLDLFRSYQAEERWLTQGLSELEKVAERLESEAANSAAVQKKYSTAPDGPTKAWTSTVSERVGQALRDIQSVLKEHASVLQTLMGTIQAERNTTWVPAFSQARGAYENLRREMEEKGVEFGQHETLSKQRASLETEISELSGAAESLRQTDERIKGSRSRLLQLHEKRLIARRGLARGLEQQDADVRLEIVPFGDRKGFVSYREDWFGGAGLQERDWETLVEYVFGQEGSISDCLANLHRVLVQDIEATRNQGRPLRESESKTWVLLGSKPSSLTRNFYNALQKHDRIRMDDMEAFLPEDRVDARVRGTDGVFKPIDQGSIGQRSTAILALLLSAGDQPLVIDQPEDDLDNQYVYDVVVDLLRKRKFSRQIIMATHNANIPVNGDAEMIFALGVENRLGKVMCQGSIDRPEVKETVTVIMEGSAEAFRLRRERYGY